MHESWLPREHSLHRPRHANRQRFALACAVVFLVLPAVGYAFGVRPTAFENHRLASFPSPSLGWSFFVRLAPWATDHLAFREQAIHAADGLSRGLFGEPPAYGGNSNELPPIPTDQGSTAAKPIQLPSVMQGHDGWL